MKSSDHGTPTLQLRDFKTFLSRRNENCKRRYRRMADLKNGAEQIVVREDNLITSPLLVRGRQLAVKTSETSSKYVLGDEWNLQPDSTKQKPGSFAVSGQKTSPYLEPNTGSPRAKHEQLEEDFVRERYAIMKDATREKMEAAALLVKLPSISFADAGNSTDKGENREASSSQAVARERGSQQTTESLQPQSHFVSYLQRLQVARYQSDVKARSSRDGQNASSNNQRHLETSKFLQVPVFRYSHRGNAQ